MQNGIIVEPTDHKAVSTAILEVMLHKDKWAKYSANGNKNILAYSWPSHTIKYLDHIETILLREKEALRKGPSRKGTQGRHSMDQMGAAVHEYLGEMAQTGQAVVRHSALLSHCFPSARVTESRAWWSVVRFWAHRRGSHFHKPVAAQLTLH